MYTMIMQEIALSLLAWFHDNKRDLPWRSSKNGYRVLVSEVMLQQTQVSRVISYFSRWMNQFPTMHHLAQASQEEVIRAWEGLGYYSRARSLHRAAQYVVAHFDGVLPQTKKELMAIPGIGPYTAGAILSFAFSIPTPAVDANVLRVITRLYDMDTPITSQAARTAVEARIQALLSHDESNNLMEAFIEVGALVCTSKRPKCVSCPLKEYCESYQKGVVHLRPAGKTTSVRIDLYRYVLVFWCQREEKVLVLQRRGKKIMSGLYEFPFYEAPRCPENKESPISCECDALHQYLKEVVPEGVVHKELHALQPVRHSFTRFHATLFPRVIQVDTCFSFSSCGDEAEWISQYALSDIPFSSGHRRISSKLKEVLSPDLC